MRLRLLLGGLLLLAGCGGGGDRLATHAPGLPVAQAALDSGSPQIALNVATEVLQRSPTDGPALLVKGQALTALGQDADAEATFRRALELNAGSAEARLGLGRLTLKRDPRAAELLFLDVLGRAPRNAIALNDLGIARDLQGRHGEAQAAYRQALGVAPSMQAATVNLALSMALSGDPTGGLDLLRPLAAAEDATPRVRHDYAAIAEMAGDHAAAEATLKPDLSPADLNDALRSYDALSVPAPRTAAPGSGARLPASASARTRRAEASGRLVSRSPSAWATRAETLMPRAEATRDSAAQNSGSSATDVR